MGEPITVITAVAFKRWLAPNYASQAMPPRPRQEGMQAAPTIPVAELPHQVLDAHADAWLTDLYHKHGSANPWANARDQSPTEDMK